MDDAAKGVGKISAPTAFFYGQKDEIVPKEAAFTAAARLCPDATSAYYPEGYHMILRDLHAQVVWDDILAFIRDPKALLPSGAPPVPKRRKTMKKR